MGFLIAHNHTGPGTETGRGLLRCLGHRGELVWTLKLRVVTRNVISDRVEIRRKSTDVWFWTMEFRSEWSVVSSNDWNAKVLEIDQYWPIFEDEEWDVSPTDGESIETFFVPFESFNFRGNGNVYLYKVIHFCSMSLISKSFMSISNIYYEDY